MIFHVVEFTSNLSKEKTVIPDTWMSINNNTCAMPPLASDEQLEEAIKNPLEPEDGWAMYSIKSLMTFESYDEAKDYLQKCKEGLSDDEPRRKRKKPSYLSNYTSMDSDEEHNTSKSPKILATRIKREANEELEMEELSDIEWIPSSEQNQGDRSSFKESSSDAYCILKDISSQAASGLEDTDMSCPCNSTCHNSILQVLFSIQRQMDKNTRILQQLLGHKVLPVTALQSLPKTCPIMLPATQRENLEEIENWLQEDTNFAQTLSYFSALGGNNYKQTLARMLERLISAELANQMNWKGRGDKKPFENFHRIHSLIYHTAKQNPACEGIRMSDVERFIKDWLRFAPDRFGGRLKRYKKKFGAEESPSAEEKTGATEMADSGA